MPVMQLRWPLLLVTSDRQPERFASDVALGKPSASGQTAFSVSLSRQIMEQER